jgi:hypothetical protein
MYPQHPEISIEMDNSMANFAKVDSVHYFQTTDFTQLHRTRCLTDCIRCSFPICGKKMTLMLLPEDGPVEHVLIISPVQGQHLQHTIDSKSIIAKPTCFKEITVFTALFHGHKGR